MATMEQMQAQVMQLTQTLAAMQSQLQSNADTIAGLQSPGGAGRDPRELHTKGMKPLMFAGDDCEVR